MTMFMPYNNNPSATYQYDSSDGLKTVGAGKYWRVKVNTPTGHYFHINGDVVQSRDAGRVNATIAVSSLTTLHTVGDGKVLEGMVSAGSNTVATIVATSASADLTNFINVLVHADGSAKKLDSLFVKLSEATVLYGMSTGSGGRSNLDGIEYVDGPKFGEYWLKAGDTCRMFDSSGWGVSGAYFHIEEYNVP